MAELLLELEKFENPKQAEILQRFFKTGKGQYGEGDIFLGLKVGEIRKVAKRFSEMGLAEVKKSLYSKVHEERLACLLVLVQKFEKGGEEEQERIVDFYLKNARQVNNWDLVDLTAPKITGQWLLDRGKAVLYKLAASDNLWERRIAILSTFAFIRKGRFEDCLAISEKLLQDKQDLIHKAVGWMLREVGKKDLAAEEAFLKKHYRKMPRTMLRYAIEKFPEPKRKAYLNGKI